MTDEPREFTQVEPDTSLFAGAKENVAAKGGGDPEGHDLRMEAEIHFLNCSIAVWREIDRLTAENDGVYPGLPSSTELRVREREAWEHYRKFLDGAALSALSPDRTEDG